MKIIIICLAAVLAGCTGIPEGITPVKEFELTRYLGKWYEIARLDHSFERGLEQVSAEYTLREDGGVRVINQGYSPLKQQWNIAEGKAYFVNQDNEGYLKVSFFGPFYGAYVIFELEQAGYDYAFIAGPNRSYLWLLSRTATLPESVIAQFKQRAEDLGFDLSALIMVKQQ